MFLASSLSTYGNLLSWWSYPRKLTDFNEHVLIDRVHIIRLILETVPFHVWEIEKSGHVRMYVIYILSRIRLEAIVGSNVK